MEAPAANLRLLSGIFGTLPAGEMPACADASTVLIGWDTVRTVNGGCR
ncbi:hypothetical protein ACK85N_004775 [Salmonella enterica]|nr:hypothetical protein [Salmonella enterica]EGS6736647.1 hypothetical protein [Salmonella enterica]EGZ5755537.1 hypothetical protein [Salmonella enterica]EHF8124856.1 hypothetical protein [Salmonella enterica]EHJ6152903.1 hypothetical protein [Salmonella enterica]